LTHPFFCFRHVEHAWRALLPSSELVKTLSFEDIVASSSYPGLVLIEALGSVSYRLDGT
jgi:hypothetical protein